MSGGETRSVLSTSVQRRVGRAWWLLACTGLSHRLSVSSDVFSFDEWFALHCPSCLRYPTSLSL